MEFLKKIGSWADELTKIGISIVALGVVLEVGRLSSTKICS